MRRLGIIGGVTWHSTSTYYQHINLGVANRLGPFRSADLLLHSLDYGVVRDSRANGDYRPLAKHVVAAARGLRRAGADGLLLASNSLHGVAKQVRAEVGLPLLHIGDALADEALARGLEDLAFFGTGFTMGRPFLLDHLRARGLTIRLPADRTTIDHLILEELAQGVVTEAARTTFLQQLDPLVRDGAMAMVLGCTEIPLLIGPEHTDVPLLNTLDLHADAAVSWILAP